MNQTESPAYGLWMLVIINSAVFIIFAFSFAKPQSSRDWRSFGAFSAFIVALFTEMYGFPLTIYLLSGWLSTRFPGIDFFSHDAGHLLEIMFGWKANPHFGPFHLLSFAFIGGGFWLLSSAWQVLYAAQRKRARHRRSLRTYPPSAVRRVRAHHVWFPVSVAHTGYANNVSDPCVHVRASRKEGRGGDARPVR